MEKPTAIITGASQGLGLEIARLLAARGFRLVLNARREAALAAAARELGAEYVVGDVSEVAEEIAARAGERVDVLVNNASELGPSPMPPLEHFPWEALLRVYRVNVVAPIHLAQLVIPSMRARGKGVVVNVTSDAGTNAYAGWGGYGSSKAALNHATAVLAKELEGSGVRALVIDPGDMNTEMHRLAEPGVDLSHLPGPEGSAAAIVEEVAA